MNKRRFSFPDALRLKKPADFKKIFANPIKSTDRYFTLLAIKNGFKHPRLGLAVAKRNVKRAVDRNKIKRVSRESFRLQQHNLTTLDVVVLARRDAATATTTVLEKSLKKHWLKLVKQCASY